MMQKYGLPFGVILIGLILAAGFYVDNFTTVGEEDMYDVNAKWKFQCKDILNEGSAAASGTLAIYDPSNPGVALESSLSISSGAFTTGQSYSSGRELFLKYTDSTYFDYGLLVTIPQWDSTFDSVPTLDHPSTIWVYKMADMLQGSSNTDVDGLKNGASSWDDSSTSLSAFNRTADGNTPKLGIMLTDEDTETAYVDPRGYYDYSSDVEANRDRKSYLIIEFQPTGTTTSGVDVNDYLRFQTYPAGMIKKKMGTSMVLFYPLTAEDAPYIYDIDTDSNPISQKDGNGIVFEITFDFSGAIASAIGADDIDIEVSVDTGFPMGWFETHEALSSVPGDDPLGEMATAWTNDWSIGW